MTVALACLTLSVALSAPADAPLAQRVSPEDLGAVKRGEIVVRRQSSGGRVETVVAAKIDAPPAWVYAQVSDLCRLDNSTKFSAAPRYLPVAATEAAVAAAGPKELDRDDVDKLTFIPCAQAAATPTLFSLATWDLPFPVPDGWALTRTLRTPAGEGGGSLRATQVAGSLSAMEYHTDVTPLDGGTLFVAVSVFKIPFPVPGFLLSNTDQSSKHVIAIRERAKAAPWRPGAPAAGGAAAGK